MTREEFNKLQVGDTIRNPQHAGSHRHIIKKSISKRTGHSYFQAVRIIPAFSPEQWEKVNKDE